MTRTFKHKARGEGKPETFEFIGFTHICAETHINRKFVVKRYELGLINHLDSYRSIINFVMYGVSILFGLGSSAASCFGSIFRVDGLILAVIAHVSSNIVHRNQES